MTNVASKEDFIEIFSDKICNKYNISNFVLNFVKVDRGGDRREGYNWEIHTTDESGFTLTDKQTGETADFYMFATADAVENVTYYQAASLGHGDPYYDSPEEIETEFEIVDIYEPEIGLTGNETFDELDFQILQKAVCKFLIDTQESFTSDDIDYIAESKF